jgi:hypothetical protein
MAERISVIDPRTALDKSVRNEITHYIGENPHVDPIGYIANNFASMDRNSAACLLTSPEKANRHAKIRETLIHGLHDLVRLGLPDLAEPWAYDPEQFVYGQPEAQQIKDLHDELSQYSHQVGNSFQNPLDSIVSLRNLRADAGTTTAEIQHFIARPIHFGALKVTFRINTPRESKGIIKKAMRESVHGNADTGSLHAKKVDRNVERIISERRMVGIHTIDVLAERSMDSK